MGYRVLLPTAGLGSRLGKYTVHLNKSLVSVDNKPVLSHQIDSFPSDCEFVIALGYKGSLVRDYIEITHPKNKFIFVNVNPFNGKGSGLGYTIKSCHDFLQEKFVFISCDTLIKETIPPPNCNWIGLSTEGDHSTYRLVQLQHNKVKDIKEKSSEGQNLFPYIGLAGIYDYRIFWEAIHQGGEEAITIGESYGLKVLSLNKKVEAVKFTWFDTGQIQNLAHARKHYSNFNKYNILEKDGENIWFVNDKVIKFSSDQEFISNRVVRSKELEGFVPKILSSRNNMYCYRKITGTVLSECITIDRFINLLDKCKKFWRISDLSKQELKQFHSNCKQFYKDKTLKRIRLFYSKFDKDDSITIINGKEVRLLSKLLDLVSWDYMSFGIPGRFHGDLHFENILYSIEDNEFTFIDWRQDFAGQLYIGDINYDLAKILHGLIVSHEVILNDGFTVSWGKDSLNYTLYRKSILCECEEYLYDWCTANNYDVRKIKILTSLIYLNIAALHHYPYSLLLYSLGTEMLNDLI